ncbi:MAG: hypothetical protein WCW84_07075 [Sulfurimonas sp.]|jgi:hypothetical protein
MKKVVLSTVVAMALATSSFAWGLPSVPSLGADSSKSSGTALTAADIDVILVSVKNATALLDGSVSKLSSALLDKDAKAKIDAEMEKAQKITDTKERDAKIAEARTSQIAELKKATESVEGKEKISKLNKTQLKSFASATFNFSLAGLMDLDAVSLASAALQKALANPMAVMSFSSKVDDLKSVVATLPVQAGHIGTIGSKIVDLAKSNKIQIKLPTSNKQKPEAVEG